MDGSITWRRRQLNPMDRLSQYLHSIGCGEASLDGWTVSIAKRAGMDVAIVATHGPEIHILPFEHGKAMSRRNIAEFLNPLIDEYGYASTRVPIAEEDHRLRVKLGFVMTWEDEQFTYWTVTEHPFKRKTT